MRACARRRPHARSYTAQGDVKDATVRTYYNSVNGYNTKLYYQRYVNGEGGSMGGCTSGSAAWFGLVRVKQKSGDNWPAGIGGHCDGCKISGKGAS